MEALKARAEAGDVEAMYELGLSYFSPWVRVFAMPNRHVAEDYRAALEWYCKAAAQRHSKALFALGYMHEYGKGIPANVVQALAYYRKANETGYPCTYDIESVTDAIAADPALRAAAAVAAAAAAVEEQRAADNTRRQRALEQEAARLQQENTRLQRDRVALDAEKARHEQQIAQERASWNADKAREQKAVTEERVVLEADQARLQQDRKTVDGIRLKYEETTKRPPLQHPAAAKQEASAKQAKILTSRRAEGSNYSSIRDAVAAAWSPTKFKILDCPVHREPLVAGQTVLLDNCLHCICRKCARHMLRLSDSTIQCPVCQANSTVDPSALQHHPFVEAELAAGQVHDCIMCQIASEDDRLPATVKCTSCTPEKLLCEAHSLHHRIRMPTHATTPLSHGGAALRCPTHDQPFAAYCASCGKLVCFACFASTHPAATHPAHLLTDTAFVETVRQRLVKGVAVARRVADALVDHAADATIAVSEVDERNAEFGREIDRAMDVLAGLLERCRETAHEERLARSREERANHHQTREEVAHHWRMVTSAADLAEQLAAGTHLGVNATAVMVRLEAAATARLDFVIGLAPDRDVPAPSIYRFEIDESVGQQLAGIGRIVLDA